MVKFNSEISDVIEDILLIYKNITTIKKEHKSWNILPNTLLIRYCAMPHAGKYRESWKLF